VEQIGELIGVLTLVENTKNSLFLRRDNRIKSIHASLQIENNTLSLEQVTAIISGKKVLGHPREIKEVQNAYDIYDKIEKLEPDSETHFLSAHNTLMSNIDKESGKYRSGGVGILKGKDVVHIAPGADRVKFLMKDLFDWLKNSDEHPLIKSSVFHYETEFIHPFSDGNGRIGRLWQTVILSKWKPLFVYLPVETVIRDNQYEYYSVLGEADNLGDCTCFVEFMLSMIYKSLTDIKSDQVGDYVSDQVKELLVVLNNQVLSPSEIMKKLSLSHRTNFRKNYLNPALKSGLIEMTNPDKPSSSNQKYRLTLKGQGKIK